MNKYEIIGIIVALIIAFIVGAYVQMDMMQYSLENTTLIGV